MCSGERSRTICQGTEVRIRSNKYQDLFLCISEMSKLSALFPTLKVKTADGANRIFEPIEENLRADRKRPQAEPSQAENSSARATPRASSARAHH